MGASPLRILMVEDSADDQALITRALSDLGPMTVRVVASEPALRSALLEFAPQAVLSDFSMPGFSGQRALEVVQEMCPGTPFLFVSGTIGEERAIDALQRGADDYVLKDNLRRLRPALERALRNASERDDLAFAANALRESEERFRAIAETTGDWIWQTDKEGRLTYCNDSTQIMLGYSPESLLNRIALDLLVGDDRAEAKAVRATYIAEKRGWRDEVRRWRHADGSVVWLESTAKPMLDSHGELTGYRGVNRDVTLRVQQAGKIEHLARMHAVLSTFGNAILRSRDLHALLDMTCRLLVEQGGFAFAVVGRLGSDGLLRVGHRFGNTALGEHLEKLGAVDPESADARERPSVRALATARTVVIADFRGGGVPSDWPDHASAFGISAQASLPIGQPAWGVLSVCTRLDKAFEAEEIALLERLTGEIDYARKFIAQSEHLEHLVYHNPTTGLPSRTALHQKLQARLAQGSHAVAVVDVARFRYFNQSRGRGFGDQLLRGFATRLRALLPADSLLAHPGDDEFVVCFRATNGIDSAVAEVENLLAECCDRPLLVDGEQVRGKLHGAVLLAPQQAADGEQIERALNDALAEAKAFDRSVQAFTEESRHRSARRVELERELRDAVETEQFELFLQPKVETASRRLCGAEALLRWRHPQRGLVSPAEFVPVLEETGLIVDVGAWVRRRGLAISQRWRDMGLGGLRIAVNVSVQELRQLDFVAGCEELLAPFGGDHELDLEITESMLMDDVHHHIGVLQSLRELGSKISIDDFGTGYSSLNYLSRLPADALKIDRSFVSLLAQSPDTVSLVTNIINLAHSLGLRVVAEGVEEEEQAKLLRLLRCDELQGYLLGRPLPVNEFEANFLA
jgi:PAS domain S-box-containing protein/diguanylate cyclase (GGDEF)-like protein